MNPHFLQIEADALGISAADLQRLNKDREDERVATFLGIELWEFEARRASNSAAEIAAEKEQRHQRMLDVIRA